MSSHAWEKKPVLLLILATVTILVGTIFTMVLPFAWVNTEHDRIETVSPYSPLEQAGRDLYIREGCNNCHTQTVRPLVAEVLRYGDYSKSGEFIYDRPHLWGSRRTGPDLARLGGKYPDEWHYQHMVAPTSMIPKSNMPAYGFLNDNLIDPDAVKKAMDVLGFPYSSNDIAQLEGKTEMDAMVAYLQKLGTGIPWRKAAEVEIIGELVNPFPKEPTAIAAGELLYAENCAACHGEELEGQIGPELDQDVYSDDELFELIYVGVTDAGMPSFASLGSTKVWQIVNFINYRETP
ncbi:MAG: cbb3-type cytochrome c oxidase subunit II [Deltaproteobacteria bacterium]|jgi:cytochrome c oxidase cbb3-type subunit 2|nr:cbb3-type cytochrome c oxidase subunit II [Deltaproteobacteria bacterium]MBW2503582.1 cbb3-type cytochrome c oxidase subunit II [Deltaproteobacteria bacterium]MBW2519563.1 cbb3-type cytochrome c oxidase subunit II [Deltaproteobacteria bacterium]